MTGEPLSLVTAEQFASVREPGAEPLVGNRDSNVFPAGALALVFGDGGAGKTTLLLDLAFHLAAGKRWLALDVPRRVRVAWVENEGPRGNFREKVDAKLAAWDGPALDRHLLVLEDPWGLFTFENELHRRQLAQMIAENEIEVLIVGPVQTLGVQGGGTPAEIREFAALIEQTRALLDRPLCTILVHHTNKAGDVAGAWGPVPDTTCHVSAQGNGKTRVFWQKARWASDMHGKAWHLHWRDGERFEIEEKPEVTEDTITAELLAAVAEHGGASWTKLREHVTGNATEAAKVRDRLIAAGEIVNLPARDGQFKLWSVNDPASGRSGLGTGLERLSQPPPAGAPEPCRSTVPPFYRNGGRNGTGEPEVEDDLERLSALGDELGLT